MKNFIVEVVPFQTQTDLDENEKSECTYIAEVYEINLRTNPVEFLIYSEEKGFEMVSMICCVPVEIEE